MTELADRSRETEFVAFSDEDGGSGSGSGGSDVDGVTHVRMPREVAVGVGVGVGVGVAPEDLTCTPRHLYLCVGGVVLVALVSITIASTAGAGGGGDDGDALGVYANGVVSTTNEHATRVGVDVLRRGGNAVDAAVAVQFALNVVQPQSTGIGGGCVIMLREAESGQVVAMDGREEAPAAFHANAFCRNPACERDEACDCSAGAWQFEERVTGGHPVGVPGVVAATVRMLEEHGTMSLSEVVAPAVQLARDGFPMYPHLLDRIERNRWRLLRWEASRKLFLPKAGDQPLALGETFRNPELADTLEELAERGVDWFYRGALAQEIVDAVRGARNPVTNLTGLMEVGDLDGYRAVRREPVSVTYRDEYRVWGFPTPSSGGATLGLMLNLLEAFRLGEMRAMGGEYYHRVIDAQDIAFADRNMWLGDADFVDVPLDDLLRKEYARQRVRELSKGARGATADLPGGAVPPGDPRTDDKRGSSEFGLAPLNQRHGTTHFSIIDKERNVVSWTTTIEENLGSSVVVPNRGFLLNNELTDFTANKSATASSPPYANRPEGGKRARRSAVGAEAALLGGKRPMSSMTPTIVTQNGEPRLALGSPGGSRITCTVLNVLLQLIDQGMDLQAAIDQPRIVARNGPPLAEPAWYQDRELNETLNWLREERGFAIQEYITDRPLGFVQAARVRDDGKLEAAADVTRLVTALASGW